MCIFFFYVNRPVLFKECVKFTLMIFVWEEFGFILYLEVISIFFVKEFLNQT